MPAQELKVAAERIERFKRLGGVELDRDDIGLHHEVWGGLAEYKQTTFRFRCPMCGKVEELQTEMEPMCTGPLWTDDHMPVVMMRLS